MSVLSATEGLSYVHVGFQPYIWPVALAILIGLFALQSHGTAKVGALFGPIMLGYFLMLSVLGVLHIVDHPSIILETINPINALRFFYLDGFTRSEEHTSELQSLMRISYAVFCLTKKNTQRYLQLRH